LIHQLVDDISGAGISEGGGESIDFSVRGVDYRIDLSAANAAKFDKALKPYLEAATKHGDTRRAATDGRARRKAPAASTEQLAAIREWARADGFEVSDRGRIKAEVVEAYNAAP
jgi:Lsr2